MTDSAQTRVALLLIGNELLTGKIRDLNGPHAIDTLRRVGAELVEMRVVSDGQNIIATAIRELLEHADWVVTSGGIGPTHDDVTMAAVAQALDRELEENLPLRERIERKFPDDEISRRVWARMATLPEGCELVVPDRLSWPVFLAGRVWILPGVPQTFRKQIDAIAPRFGSSSPTRAATIHLDVGEGIVAEPLEEAVTRV
jgi:molybdenum cofactor synthesis domain-containing protein